MIFKVKIIFCLLLPSITGFSQFTFNDPVSSRVFDSQRYSGVRGTPFLDDNWIKGVAFTSNYLAFKDLELKLNTADNVVLFRVGEDAMEFRDDISNFTLMPDPNDSSTYRYYKKGFKGPQLTADQYVQILSEGSLTLLKLESKVVTEMSEINAGVIKTFNPTTKYFLLKGKEISVLRLNKKEVLSYLDSQAVQDFINREKLSVRKESDVVRIFNFFNSQNE